MPRSRLWLQIVADILGTPVATLQEQEAAAYGAALQTIWTYQREHGRTVAITEITNDMVKKDKLAAEPNPDKARIYAALQ
ncbi:MAG: FGGY-family carbohydrate kinase [Candidatus Aminicenantes bacterium]|nr:FGGY-family carbohydrate kinase [Candidatus Aminicenantes bacterium]